MSNQYVVLRHSQRPVQAVKVGFSWWGLIFNDLWLLYKRLWSKFAFFALVRSFLYLGLAITIQSGSLVGMAVCVLLQFGLIFLVGYFGNAWVRDRLLDKDGYVEQGVYEGRSLEEAVESSLKDSDAVINTCNDRIRQNADVPKGDVGKWVLNVLKGLGFFGLLIVAFFISAVARQMLKS